MLLVPGDWLYAKVGGCRVEKPRWLRPVLRTVALLGEGEIGVRGNGDLAAAVLTESAGTASESLGRAARASIVSLGYVSRRAYDPVAGDNVRTSIGMDLRAL